MFASIKMDTLIQLQEKIDARVMRERLLIFITAAAVVFMAWNFLVQLPIEKQLQESREQLALLAAQRTSLQTQITATTQSLLNDPNKPKKLQIAQLQSDIGVLETQLHSVSQNLIKADQLPHALQDVLEKTAQLTLLEVKTLPAQELQFVAVNTPTNVSPTTTDDLRAGVFQHVVELRVSGSFSQVVEFLIALEHLPWRFYWQSLDYSVVHYPNAEVRLRVYTLSSEEGLLGV